MKVAVDIDVRREFLLEIGDVAAVLVTELRAGAGGLRQPIQILLRLCNRQPP